MPRVVKIEFDVNGQQNGTQTIDCDSGGTLTGNFNVFLAWDKGEQKSSRSVRATIKLARPGLIFGRILTRDRATVSAADPGVPNFIWPSPYEILGPLLGWKVTMISTAYTYSCSSQCALEISSSRGGSWKGGNSEEEVRGIITLRSGNRRYDRKSAAVVTVQCQPKDDEVAFYRPGFDQCGYDVRMDRILEQHLLFQDQSVETQVVESVEALVATRLLPIDVDPSGERLSAEQREQLIRRLQLSSAFDGDELAQMTDVQLQKLEATVRRFVPGMDL